MSGGTGKICLYLDGLMDHNKQYTDYYQLPSPTEFDEEVVSGLKHMQLMGGKEQVEYWPEDNDAYIRAKWCKLCLNGMPVPLLRNCYSIFNGTKYR